jgi:glycosyltransferase involved in cell wall biosynthesis
VTIGLPVYNGEAFLAEALDSLLAQTFTDFEVVISDNASTDGTEAICRERAGRDARVVYTRNATNVGAMRNFNQVFERVRGEYFKWAAHDDLHDPDYLRQCVEVLDAHPEVVLVHPRSRDIDETGRTLTTHPHRADLVDARVTVRFRDVIRREHSCQMIFGVIRTDILRRTRMFANYADCDRVLLAELALAGPFFEIADVLFIHREHKNRSVWQYKSRQTRGAWFDPRRAGMPAMPYTRQFWGYVGAIRRSPNPPGARVLCGLLMGGWLLHNADGLWEDLSYAIRYRLRPFKRKLMPPGNGSHAPGRPNDHAS